MVIVLSSKCYEGIKSIYYTFSNILLLLQVKAQSVCRLKGPMASCFGPESALHIKLKSMQQVNSVETQLSKLTIKNCGSFHISCFLASHKCSSGESQNYKFSLDILSVSYCVDS